MLRAWLDLDNSELIKLAIEGAIPWQDLPLPRAARSE